MVNFDQLERDIDEGKFVDFETLDWELKWEFYLSLVPIVFAVVFIGTLLWIFHV